MRYLIGVDFGGGSSKATLLREDGAVVATAAQEYPTAYPKMGWAEQDPEDSYRTLVYNIRALLRESAVSPDDISAIALDGATHTAVLLDDADRVIRPSIYWTDRRSAEQADRLLREHQGQILEQALNVPSPLWTLPQLIWLREREPESFGQIHRILFMKDYVRYRLTGDFVTDRIEAMGSMLLDARTETWSPALCALAGISPEVLPELVSPTQILSPLRPEAAQATGLRSGTRVIAGATDTVMEVYASGAIHPGQATVKLATAGRICAVSAHGVAHPLLVNYRHVVDGLWYPGTATKSCAASYRWYRDVLCGGEVAQAARDGTDPYEQMDAEAARVPPGSDQLYFHPYLQGEITPYLDNHLRASFTGISAFHTKGHFSRAVMEGVAYSLKEGLLVLHELGMPVERATIIGGGAKSPLWRQIVADVLDIPLLQTVNSDSSLGSAMLAGVATGVFASFEESVEKCVKRKGETHPGPAAQTIYAQGFDIYKRIHDALAPVYRTIAAQGAGNMTADGKGEKP